MLPLHRTLAVIVATLALAACQTPQTIHAPTAITLAAGPKLPPAPLQYAPAGTKLYWTGWRLKHGTRTSWENSPTVFETANGIEARYRNEYGNELRQIRFCTYCENALNTFEKDKYLALWPLETGKRVTYLRKRKSQDLAWQHTVTVLGTETIDTGFGPVDTYVVREDMAAVFRTWQGTRTHWWAPSIGYAVKAIRTDNKGYSSEVRVVRVERP